MVKLITKVISGWGRAFLSNAVQLRGEGRINSPARWPTPEEIFLVKSVLFPKKLLCCVGGEVKNKDLVFID